MSEETTARGARIAEIERVQQEDPLGCGVACLAMISGRTYADVRATINPAQVEHGLSDHTIIWWLSNEGFWHRRSWPDGEFAKPVPTSGIALALTHDAHWIVLQDGRAIDPARETPLASYDIRQVIEVLQPSALTRAREAEALQAELRARIRLLDNVCHSHHSASLVTWDGECPVCAEAGGITFYEENARLYRASIPSETDQ